ncbi:recombinase family protein [Bengtsoniella intestinalis]|uniref:recombinase family protein n=1 Tax=Bengtsoniella intestinalis TaxID=3073143 RepID=UPI00391F1CEE
MTLVTEQHLYMDKLSGKDFNRPAWKKLVKRLKQGDTLVIKSLDRLGRNYLEIGEQWRYITTEIKADIKVLDMPLLDTGAQKDLIGTLISDLVLMLLAYVSQQEREFIRQRQAEGIAAAQARGVKCGRRAAPNPKGFDAVYADYMNGALTAKEAGEKLGIKATQFQWLVKRIDIVQDIP